MRTFVAIETPESIRAALAELSQRLRRSGVHASWVKPQAMHLTLRFLGEITPEAAAQMGDVLATGYGGLGSFELRVAGLGAFPNLHNPAVVWVGVGPLEGDLSKAQCIAEEAALAIGLKREKRPFHPHLTLARIKDSKAGERLASHLARERTFDGGAFTVSAVSLFSSTLTPRGPIYRQLREFALQQPREKAMEHCGGMARDQERGSALS